MAQRTVPERPRPQARTTFSAPKPEEKEDVLARTLSEKDRAAETNAPAEKRPAVKVAEQSYHMIVEAETVEEGLAIAIEELRAVHTETGVKNSAAKTSADKLNRSGLSPESLKRIRGKDFIVEIAGDLSEENLEIVCDLIKNDRSGMIVALIDTPEGLDRLDEKCPEIFEICDVISDEDDEPEEKAPKAAALTEDDSYDDDDVYEDEAEDGSAAEADDVYDEDDEDGYDEEPEAPRETGRLNIRVNVPEDENEEMELDDFAQFCAQYASEIDCSIDGKSMLALYERIELMEEDGIPLTKKTAIDLIEETADRAEKPPIGKRLTGMFKSKYDKNGCLILKEEDFIY